MDKFSHRLKNIKDSRDKLVELAEKTLEKAKNLVEKLLIKEDLITPNKIYSFSYNNPITKVHKWDTRPLVIVMGLMYEKTGKQMLTVNLHWLPPAYRKQFWDYIVSSWKFLRLRRMENSLPLLIYTDIKNNVELSPAKAAIRKYLIKNVRNIKEVPEEHFDKIFAKYQSKVVIKPKRNK